MRRNDPLYGSLSYWRASVPERPARPAPRRDITYDVAIVGGGFHGLWTAYHLKKADPSLSVAIVEQNHIGFGASGRNGGFAMTKVGLRLEDLDRIYGGPAVKRVFDTMGDKVNDLIATVRAEGIDCELDHGGLLVVATNAAQERRLQAELAAASRIGLSDLQPLDRHDLRARVNSPLYRQGAFEQHCAVLHPLKLCLGIAEVVTREGAVIFEDTRVDGVDLDGPVAVLKTGEGDLRARKVVMTINAWAGRHPLFNRTIVPVYTYILSTEPIADERWAEIGWEGREGIEDSRSHIHFYRRTHDGRLNFGGTDNIIPFLGKIDRRHDSNERCYARLEQAIATTFPQLAGVKIEYRWGGAFAMTPDYTPRYGAMADGKLIYGHGCCGHGVGLSFFGGQILRDLVLERPSEAEGMFFVPPSKAAYPVEPLRSIGGSLTLAEARWHDDAQDRGVPATREPFLLRAATRMFGG